MNKMYISKELIDSLMGLLYCVAISTNGGCPIKDGKIVITEEQKNLTQDYAMITPCNILDDWTSENEEWEIRG